MFAKHPWQNPYVRTYVFTIWVEARSFWNLTWKALDGDLAGSLLATESTHVCSN